MSLVSVIIPSYNYAEYIKESILSVVEQTYAFLELIIIDDCSTDQSVSVINELISHPEIKERFVNIVFETNKKNKGAHYTINCGIELAKGKYIAVLNADDLYEKNRFEKMVALLEDTGAKLAFSSVTVIDEDSKPLTSEEARYFEELPKQACGKETLFILLLQSNITVSTGNLLFEKNLYIQLNGFRKFKYIHDWDFVLRALLVSEPVLCYNTYYYYRLHSTNTFRSLQNIADIEVKLVLTDFIIKIKKGEFTNLSISHTDIMQQTQNCFFKNLWNNACFFYKMRLKLQYAIKKFIIRFEG